MEGNMNASRCVSEILCEPETFLTVAYYENTLLRLLLRRLLDQDNGA